MGHKGAGFKSRVYNAQAVVIDNGSGVCKAGFSGEVGPQKVIASVLGCPRSKLSLSKAKQKECYIGEEAQSKREALALRYPIEGGFINSWDDMEKIWKYIYDKGLGVKPFERPLFMTESPLNPKEDRAKLTQLMFERFKVPAFYLSVPAILSLYASARYTGVVMDSGFGTSLAVPVYEGYCLPHAVTRLELGGKDVTALLRELLLENRHFFRTFPEGNNFAEDIKVKLCFVAVDSSQEQKSKLIPKEYELPDGNRIKIGDPLFLAPEILFTPSSIHRNGPGLHKMIARSIKKCDPSIRRDLYGNMLLAGGSSLFPGLDERVFKELENQVPQGVPIKVISPPDRWFSTWIGGSIITSMSTFKQMWVTATDYREYGPNIVQRRCF
ncbi:Actin-related protein T2 [Varanus komodoensis]|uniref:actin-related protein T2-like n=1 Tax=Varanus komodoensis TaxID=61221 RepID=UPI001CF77865|nr:actin-related protein T2-like [Varanus komodoensis]KAF7239366.1 Actin-related protein T2 [Varanus komodoensis]